MGFGAVYWSVLLVQENQVELKLNWTHQLLINVNGVSLLGDNTIKKNAEALIDADKEMGLELNTEKRKYMLMSHQNARQNGKKRYLTDHLKM